MQFLLISWGTSKVRSEHLYERGFFWATFLVLVLFCMEQGKICSWFGRHRTNIVYSSSCWPVSGNPLCFEISCKLSFSWFLLLCYIDMFGGYIVSWSIQCSGVGVGAHTYFPSLSTNGVCLVTMFHRLITLFPFLWGIFWVQWGQGSYQYSSPSSPSPQCPSGQKHHWYNNKKISQFINFFLGDFRVWGFVLQKIDQSLQIELSWRWMPK